MPDTTKLFNCPGCGAPLEPPTGQSVMKCPYCKSSVIIPGALNAVRTPGINGVVNMERVVHSLRNGNKIEAIKVFRQMTNSGLAEAKDVIDAIERGESIDVTRFLVHENGEEPPESAEEERASTLHVREAQVVETIRTERRRSGRSLVWILALVIFIAGATLFFINLRKPLSQSNLIAIFPSPTPAFATQLLSFGEEGTGAGMVNDPRAIGVDRSGNIYVGDYGDGRIQIFDAQGNFLKMVNLGSKTYITALAVAPDGTFYACYSGEIHHFDASGQETGLLDYETPPQMGGYFDNMTIGADGSIYAVDQNESIVRFGPDGKINLTIPEVFTSVTGDSELDMIPAVDGLGNIYVLGTFNNLVLKYSPEGKYLDQFGGETQHPAEGVEPGHFQAPDTIAVDGYGRIYVSDIWGVQVFNSSGQYIDFFEPDGVAFGMVFDLQNNLYVASSTPRILVYRIQKP